MVLPTDKQIEQTVRALKRHKFAVTLANNVDEARRLLSEVIPVDAIVGIGDSTTVRQIGILSELEKRGTKVVNPFSPEVTGNWDLLVKTIKKALQSDVFLTGSNAVTLDGRLMSTDMVGNRVVGMIFGVPKVVIVIGKNKIVRDLDEARKRLKEVIAPYHAQAKNRKVPCAKTGRCTDCDARERICNATVILEAKPFLTDVVIILVNDDLGLSWDPRWHEERINKIKSRYHEVTWSIPVPDEAVSRGRQNNPQTDS